MKNKKNSNGFIIPLIVIIVAIAIGGGVYYAYKQETKPVTLNLSDTSALPITNNTSAPAQSSSVTPQDCGTIVNTPPNSGTSTPQAIQNAASYNCMSIAVADCSPATLTVPVPISVTSPTPVKNPSDEFQNKTFTVLHSTVDYCPVQQKADDGSSYSMTCNIPNDFIDAMLQYLKPKNQMQYFFPVVQFAFSPSSTPATQKPQLQNPETKQPVHVQCSDSDGATWLST